MSLTEQQTLELKNALKRCRPDTFDAAVHFRNTGDVTVVPTIVYGIVERHLPAEVGQKLDLRQASDQTRLVEDLAIDSLTLLEIVLSIEETLAITIDNEELREIQTLGEVKRFINRKLTRQDGDNDAAAHPARRTYQRTDLLNILPQQPPFLFLDSAEIEADVVRARYEVRGDEHFLEGHFRGNPVFPASIVFEAVGQAACLWLLQSAPERLPGAVSANEVLFASLESAHFYRRAKPGDTLEMVVNLQKLRSPLAIFAGAVTVRGEKVAAIEHLVLAFGPELTEHLAARETASGAEGGTGGGSSSSVAVSGERPGAPAVVGLSPVNHHQNGANPVSAPHGL